MRQAKDQQGMSLETTKANDVEPTVENVRAEIEEQKKNPANSTIISD